MQISILCSDQWHPIMPYLKAWKLKMNQNGYSVSICSKKGQLSKGDILFLISCSEKISSEERRQFENVLVLHASDLPKGRGWSPHIWEILNGSSSISLSLINAADEIDTGAIWQKIHIPIPKHFLWSEINDALFNAELQLMSWAINNCKITSPTGQDLHEVPTYWCKRTNQDSCLDVTKSLEEQFNLLRVCDPNRYPAYFEMYGHKYKLKLEKYDEK